MPARLDAKVILMLDDLTPAQVRDAAIAAGFPDPLAPTESLREELHAAYFAGRLAGSIIVSAWEGTP